MEHLRILLLLAVLAVVCHSLKACPANCHCHGGELQHVICYSAGLTKIPKVSEQTRLVNLQKNSFPVLAPNSFKEMKGLVSLHMQYCGIKEVASGAFRGLKRLVYLYLSHNDISVIGTGAFDELPELTYLYMDHNKIIDIPKGLLSPLANLFIFQLSSNKVRELKAGTFAGAKDLRWLYLADNELTTLQPGSLDEVENLAIFHLDGNQLNTYPLAAVSKLRVVEDFKISRNPIKVIPDYAFQSFGRYMESLSMEQMGIEKLRPASVSLVSAFSVLHRCKNPKLLYPAFGFPKQTEVGDRMLREQEEEKAFVGVTALKNLNIEGNKLSQLPANAPFSSLQNLTLANNPWHCSCQLAPLRRWIDGSRTRPDATCASPAQFRGQQLRDTGAFRGCKQPVKKSKKGERH